MKLEELEQIKASIEDGVLISKATWQTVLDHAIKLQKDEEEYLRWAAENIDVTQA